jgi:endonuclease/exonuclease/phosphatase (EEP) superfamily protein YafD
MTAPPGELRPVSPAQPARRQSWSGRVLRVLRYLFAAAFTALSAVVVLPDLLGLDGRAPFAQVVAFRPWLLLAGVGVAGVLGLLVWRVRRVRPTLAPFAAGALAVLVAGTAMVAPRLVADPLPTGGRELTVLAFNAYEGEGDPAQLAALIAEQQPDLVSISEAGRPYLAALGPLVEPLGYRAEVSSEASADVAGVTMLVSQRMGAVTFRIGTDTAAFPYLEATGGELGPLRFVAFHAAAPIRHWMGQWRHDLGLLAQWCAGPTPAIVAGDFNATLDHSPLRAGMTGCADAAAQRGAGLVPTWSPTERTQPFGPQIDHVIATDGIEAETFTVHDIDGSDHRAIVTRVRVP